MRYQLVQISSFQVVKKDSQNIYKNDTRSYKFCTPAQKFFQDINHAMITTV